ncbi:MAG: hypothetical protein DSM106950_30965 [Stigonema ocellatum SAG 48.90 = DSM 106950]|nr:hypothetical protein [Stigonema ocellatum SAG 48.90 = DSM 106950]
METNDKKELFTAVTEEECSTVSGGDLISDIASALGYTITTPVNNSGTAGVTSDGKLFAGISNVNGTAAVVVLTPLSAKSVSNSGGSLGTLSILNL